MLKRVRLHPHASARIEERGATAEEVKVTVRKGEHFPAKLGRSGYRKNFMYAGLWQGKYYENKQVECYAVEDKPGEMLVITVIVKFF